LTVCDSKFQKKIDNLLKKFDITPKNYKYYFMAFTHPSAAENTLESYEHLEFFGDAIVLCHVVYELTKTHPESEVGILSRAKSHIVSGDNLAKVAFKLKLDKIVRYDESILNSHGKISNNIMADILEAFCAAVYLDLGAKKVQQFLIKVFDEILKEDLMKGCHGDYKSILQERIQQLYKEIPKYALMKTSGPDHDKTFHIKVCFHGVEMGTGKGRTKKIAEQEAAAKTLKKFEVYKTRIDKMQ